MGFLDRAKRKLSSITEAPDLVHVADPRHDDWEVVREFEDLETARAWQQALIDAGLESALTSDWELDRFKRGDIQLQVPPGQWSDAEELLSNYEFE